jgi:Flp pilus assembly pilin Flp
MVERLRRLTRRLRTSVPHRQRGQDMLEYGLIAAAVAFVALVGFNALGAAQQAYWTGVSANLNPPPPGQGNFIHPTSTVISGSGCVSGTTFYVNQQLSCTATITDVFTSGANTPLGTLTWTLDGAPFRTPCTMTNYTANPFWTCPLTYTWPVAAVGTHVLSASYTPSDNHAPSVQAPPGLTFIILGLNFNFTCNNPWNQSLGTAPPAASISVAVGEPLFCTLTVTDNLGNPGPTGLAVNVTAAPGAGIPYFACYTDDDPTSAGQHSAADATMQSGVSNAGGCMPTKGQPYTCQIVAATGGLCANDYSSTSVWSGANCPAPTCSFVYRRNYDDTGSYSSSDVLTATAPSLGLSNQSAPISISLRSMGPVATVAVLQCDKTSTYVTGTGSIGVRGVSVSSDVQLTKNQDNPLQIACSTAVVDAGRNTAFDYPMCVPPLDLHCDIDAEQAHSPLGQVTLYVMDQSHQPVLDSNNNPITYTCTLGHGAGTPAYIQNLHPLGAWFDASWCSSYTDENGATTPQLTFPVSASPTSPWLLEVSYGGNVEHAASGTPLMAPSGLYPTPELQVFVY